MENNRIDLCAPEGETPIYDQIRQELAGRIRAGSLPDGTRLPTVRELSEQLHVAEGTVKRAYDNELNGRASIKTPGRGSFVWATTGQPIAGRRHRSRLMRCCSSCTRWGSASMK